MFVYRILLQYTFQEIAQDQVIVQFVVAASGCALQLPAVEFISNLHVSLHVNLLCASCEAAIAALETKDRPFQLHTPVRVQ